MKTLSLLSPLSPAAALVLAVGIAGDAATTTGTSPDGGTADTPVTPQAPIGPYTGLVATTDVSILYPMPLAGKMVPRPIPHFGGHMQEHVAGTSPARGPLAASSVDDFELTGLVDPVVKLVAANRPAAGSPQATALQPSFDAALRLQNPAIHTAETTDCANCHLAEGARKLGESVFALQGSNVFTHARSLAYKTERLSVTNLHSFGYLHRKVSIMQRTANESVLVAEAMEQKVK